MATISFRLKARDNKKPTTIYCRFFLDNANRLEIKTDEKIEPRYWNQAAQVVKSNHQHHHEINDYLSDFKKNLIETWRKNREKGFDHFKTLIRGGIQKKTVIEIYELFLEAYKMEMDANTVRRYGSLQNHLIEFLKDHSFNIDNLDFKFYDTFRSHLYNQGNRDSSVYKYIINLKTFLAWATDRGHTVNQCFHKWKIINREIESISLTKSELTALQNKILPYNLAIARDYLLIESFTGMRISDIKRFDAKNLDGNVYSYFQKKGNRLKAKKTFVDFGRSYCAPALSILAQYNFKLPPVPEQKLNKRIKDACREAQIIQPLTKQYWKGGESISETKEKCDWITTHVGRKTFITLAAEAGMPIALIAQTLNISIGTVQKHYIAPIHEESKEKYFKIMSA